MVLLALILSKDQKNPISTKISLNEHAEILVKIILKWWGYSWVEKNEMKQKFGWFLDLEDSILHRQKHL